MWGCRMKDYKSTLQLPNTEFPMKANLPEREGSFLQKWEKEGIYAKRLQKNAKSPSYVFHDGPPYASGHAHYGTLLNKVLKDIVVKYRNMAGFCCDFIPGWDCHGLPIELRVDKELGPKKAKMSVAEIRRACRKEAQKFIDIQREEFKRMGGFAHWEKPYLTMSGDYEATIAREFGKFVEKGYVYRGKKPVFWCGSCVTALAEAEVEYADHTSPSIYVKFLLKDSKKFLKQWNAPATLPVYLVIWTTTPWTLPANLAICLHPSLTYSLLKVGKEAWVIAQSRVQPFLEELKNPEHEVLATFTGSELEHASCNHPFYKRDALVILGKHVTTDAGTGCVHTAPGHGQEDYEVGLKYGLKPFAPVDGRGCFTDEVGVKSWIGLPVEKTNSAITEKLKETQALIQETKITHSYPHCWRCKNPILFRATEQWFVSMAHENFRERALKAIDLVHWVPKWGRNRIYGMVQVRPDWCLSRQRIWGVPVVAVLCEKCGGAHTTAEFIYAVADRFEKEGGSDVWFEEDLSSLLPKNFSCPECGGKKFRRETDILDVWFDSGVSYAAVLEKRLGIQEPADLYLEGSDQHRGWFHTSLLTSIATRNRSPYKTVLTHGFVVDQEGKKLSKSAANFVPPETILKKYGAEILRLWVASEDYRNDIRFSESILAHSTDTYRKIRNTARFLLGNLSDFDPKKDAIPYSELGEVNQWALTELFSVVEKLKQGYEDFEFHSVLSTLNRFCSVELSSFYLDILKDRLYTDAKTGKSRRSAQTVLYSILDTMTRWMAPIFSFTAEDIWQHAPILQQGGLTSVFLSDLKPLPEEWKNPELRERWDRFLRMRSCVTKVLELARQEKFIGNPLEAKVILEASPDQKKFLESFGKDLADLCLVSEVEFGTAHGNYVFDCEEVHGLKAAVFKAEGAKCARCWKLQKTVGRHLEYPDLCERCAIVVK